MAGLSGNPITEYGTGLLEHSGTFLNFTEGGHATHGAANTLSTRTPAHSRGLSWRPTHTASVAAPNLNLTYLSPSTAPIRKLTPDSMNQIASDGVLGSWLADQASSQSTRDNTATSTRPGQYKGAD
jgi:hypothetical protein